MSRCLFFNRPCPLAGWAAGAALLVLLLLPSQVHAASRAYHLTEFADSSPPVTCVSTSPAGPGPSGWYTTVPLVTLTATDPEGSPVTTRYNWGADPPIRIYPGTFIALAGENVLRYCSVDVAGNRAWSEPVHVLVDNTCPIALPLPSSEGSAGGKAQRILGTATDDNLSTWRLELRPLPKGTFGTLAKGRGIQA